MHAIGQYTIQRNPGGRVLAQLDTGKVLEILVDAPCPQCCEAFVDCECEDIFQSVTLVGLADIGYARTVDKENVTPADVYIGQEMRKTRYY